MNALFLSARPQRRAVVQLVRFACEEVGARLIVLSVALTHLASEVAQVVIFDLSDGTTDSPVLPALATALRTFPPGHVVVVAHEGRAWAGADAFDGSGPVLRYRGTPDDPEGIENPEAFLLSLCATLEHLIERVYGMSVALG